MLRLTASVFLIVLMMGHAVAKDNVTGQFDYYVLSLGWSPSWCALKGNDEKARQCAPDQKFGFILHGLWPQYERGWPSFCQTSNRPPSRKMTAKMADITGSGGLAWHQWDKHGRCSGLSAAAYFQAARNAYQKIRRPAIFRKILRPITLPAPVVEAAFLRANPSLKADMITVTCARGHFQEVRICLTKDLTPRSCGADVAKDCQKRVIFPPVP